MKQNLIITTFLMLTFIAHSCSKKKEVQTDMKQIWDCNASQNFDSTKLAGKLIGSWKLTRSWSESAGTINASNNIKVTFDNSGAFAILEDSSLLSNGTWKLKIKDSNLYGLELDQPSMYLYGRILLCDNQVMFNQSYIDGIDYLFTRTN